MKVMLIGSHSSNSNDMNGFTGVVVRKNQFHDLKGNALYFSIRWISIDVSENIFTGAQAYSIEVAGFLNYEASKFPLRVNISYNYVQGDFKLVVAGNYQLRSPCSIDISYNSFSNNRLSGIDSNTEYLSLGGISSTNNQNISLVGNQFTNLRYLSSLLVFRCQYATIADNVFANIQTEILLDQRFTEHVCRVTGNMVSHVLYSDSCIKFVNKYANTMYTLNILINMIYVHCNVIII